MIEKTKDLKEDEFFELELIIRGNSLMDILGQIPVAMKAVILETQKGHVIGGDAMPTGNFSYRLTTYKDRKEAERK